MWKFVIVYYGLFGPIIESEPLEQYPADDAIHALLPPKIQVAVVYANVEKRFYCGREEMQQYHEHFRKERLKEL